MTPARPAPTPSTLGLERYVAQVLADLVPLTPRRLPLPAAHGTVLAEDLTARLPVPPWTNSAMDGYAVRAADVAGASPTTPVTCRWRATCRLVSRPPRWPPAPPSAS